MRGHGSDAREKLRCPLPERRLWAEEMHERALEIELRLGLVKEAVSDYKALARLRENRDNFSEQWKSTEKSWSYAKNTV